MSAAVEVAAYRIVREAVTNVVRHAEATRCDVILELSGGRLELAIVDDGIGLPVVPGGGVGMRSMRDRAEELGGTFFATDAVPRGTEVRASIPLVDVEVAAVDAHAREVQHDG
jgi:signal transduction histidine kinase